jgi:hypothetical protein
MQYRATPHTTSRGTPCESAIAWMLCSGVSSKKIPVFGDVVGQNARRSQMGRCPWDDDWPCC